MPRVFALLILGCVGCGLADYEDRLREDRARAKALEEERKTLGDPLELPTAEGEDTGPPALADCNVFLRAPRSFGCATKPALGKFGGIDLYAYSGQDGKYVFLAAANGEAHAAEFEKNVWTAFTQYLERRLPKNLVPTEPKKKSEELKTPPRLGREVPQPLRYNIWTWEEPAQPPQKKDGKAEPVSADREPARFYLCFYRNGPISVAVIYQLPASRADDPATNKGIEASLKSLAVGGEGLQRRVTAKSR